MKIYFCFLTIVLLISGCSTSPRLIVHENIDTLKSIVRNDPNNGISFYNLGLAHLSRDEFNEALACFQKSVERKPYFSLAHFGIYVTEYKIDKQLYRESLKDKPEDSVTKKIDSVQNHFRNAFLYDPFFSWQVGTILLESRESSSNYYTQEFFDFLYELFYDGFEAFFMGDNEKAVDKLTNTIEALPQYHQAKYFRGLAYAQLKNYDLSINDFSALIDSFETYNKNKILPIYLKTSDLYYLVGNAYFRKGDLENSLNAYKKVLFQDMSYYMAHLQLSRIYEAKKQFDKAVEELNAAIYIAPKNSLLHYNKAVFLSKISKIDQSIEEYKRTIELNKFYYEALYNLGELYTYRKQYNNAIESFKGFLDVVPKIETNAINKAMRNIEALRTKG